MQQLQHFVVALAKWCVGRFGNVHKFLAKQHTFLFGRGVVFQTKAVQLELLCVFQHHTAGFFATNANAHFSATFKEIAKTWVIGANVAQALFAKFNNHVAQPTVIQEWAPFPFAQLEMWHPVVANCASNTLAKVAFQLVVAFKASAVDVYFPPNATTVLAFFGNAVELFVVVWNNRFHFSPLPLPHYTTLPCLFQRFELVRFTQSLRKPMQQHQLGNYSTMCSQPIASCFLQNVVEFVNFYWRLIIFAYAFFHNRGASFSAFLQSFCNFPLLGLGKCLQKKNVRLRNAGRTFVVCVIFQLLFFVGNAFFNRGRPCNLIAVLTGADV